MQNMENVCDSIPKTEQGSIVNKEEHVGSADLGKFKDVNALLHAYQSLQAEFTRRSQRLKRYEEQEKQRQNYPASPSNPEKQSGNVAAEKLDDFSAGSGEAASALSVREDSVNTAATLDGEAIRENADARRDENGTETQTPHENKTDAPCADGVRPCSRTEENISTIRDISDSGADNGSNCADNKAVDNEGKSQSARVVEQSAQTLYELAAANEEVRLRIVGDYLSSIGKSNAPFVRGGVSALVASPKKPRNLADAGNMALAYLKAYKEQV